MDIGIDVGSENHYFKAFNWRGIELTEKPVPFSNSMEGFYSFYNQVVELMQSNKLEEAMVGIEPTGHYWLDLVHFFIKNIKVVLLNPLHVHRIKELCFLQALFATICKKCLQKTHVKFMM